MFELILFLVGLVVGVGSTWFFAWFYYKRAGDELRQEAAALKQETARLRRLNEHILAALADQGIGLIDRDAEGEVKRLTTGEANPMVQPIVRGQGDSLPPSDKQ